MHFFMQIVADLSRRQANYTRDGDPLRAQAAAHVLEKLETFARDCDDMVRQRREGSA